MDSTFFLSKHFNSFNSLQTLKMLNIKKSDAEILNLHQHPDKNERLVESVQQDVFNHSRPEEGRSLGLEEGRSLGLEEGRSMGLEMARSARLPNQFLKQVTTP